MSRPYRKWIQKLVAALLTFIIGLWFIGLAKDGTRLVKIVGIHAVTGDEGSKDLGKHEATLRQFVGGAHSESEPLADSPSMEVLTWNFGHEPTLNAITMNPETGKPFKGFSQWIDWQAFSRSNGMDGFWAPVGKPLKRKNKYTPDLPVGDYLLLVAIPPFDLGSLVSLGDEDLFKLLLQGANQGKRHFVGLKVSEDGEKEKQGKNTAKPPSPTTPPTEPNPTSPKQTSASSDALSAKPKESKVDLSSRTKGEREKGSLTKEKQAESTQEKVNDDAMNVPPRRDANVQSLKELVKMNVEGALPEINIELGDFPSLTHDEIKQLHEQYGVALVLRPGDNFASFYREDYAVINPVTGEVSDLSADYVMQSLGRMGIGLNELPPNTIQSIKDITKTNAWLHWDGGYAGLHFGNAILLPFAQYLETNHGAKIEDLESLQATISLKRGDGMVEIVSTNLKPTLKQGGGK